MTYKLTRNTRALLAELVGTFILVFADCGIAVTSGVGIRDFGVGARAAIAGLAVIAVIFGFGEISGAHINPAVTFSFALRGVFPWPRVPKYIAAQAIGGILAASLLWILFGNVEGLGSNNPVTGNLSAFVIESCLSLILVGVILATSHQAQIKGPESALPVGATVILCGLVGKNIGGGSMNPARSFAPALFSGSFDGLWIYLCAPLVGGAVAVGVIWCLFGPPGRTEIQSAQGE